MNDERRQFPRANCFFEATVIHNDNEIPARITDLSLNGMFILVDTAIPVGEIIDLHLDAGPDADHTLVGVTAKIVRSTAGGMGLHVEVIDLESYIRLDNIISHKRRQQSPMNPDTKAI